MSDVTHILSAIEQGDPATAEQLLPLVHDELRKLAARKMAQEARGRAPQGTALVHEWVAWLHQIIHRNIFPSKILLRRSDKVAKLGDLMLTAPLSKRIETWTPCCKSLRENLRHLAGKTVQWTAAWRQSA